MTTLLGALAAASLLAPAVDRLVGCRRMFVVLALVPAAACGWLAAHVAAVTTGQRAVQETYAWVPDLGLSLAFRLDTLSLVLALLVTGIGALVLVYCASYFEPGEEGMGRFAGVLVAFAGAMLGLVLADNLLLLYVFWELTTVFSYLLIGHLVEQRQSRLAALRALVVTTFGGLAMLVGFVLLGEAAGTYRVSELVADPPTGGVVTAGLVLALVGALSKSAIWPFSLWLPSAMAAPTPVSAYLHAAAMVKAGVYLVARLAPGFADAAVWEPLVVGLGGVTMLVGGWRALRQFDLKLLLAWGTVSQLGFMTTLVGTGGPDAALAGLALLCAHALFKSTLFLSIGVIDHSTGTRDLRQLAGVARRLPVITVAALLACASMVGITPLAGFAAKEAAFDALLHGGELVPLALVVLGSALTAGYTIRFCWGAFTPGGVPRGGEVADVHPPTRAFQVVPALLGVASLALGLLTGPWERLLLPYAESFEEGAPSLHLALWHGLTPGFGLSVLTLVVGALLFLGRHRVRRLQEVFPRLVDTERGYGRLVRLTERLAVEVTGATQRGSLPTYLGVIFLVVVLGPGLTAVLSGAWGDDGGTDGGTDGGMDVRAWDTPAQAVVVAVVALAAVATVRSRRRLKGVVLAGLTGYGVAVLFAIHGGPDLALTQVLVETVSLVVFVLVLRRLPPTFSARPLRRIRYGRALVAVGVGAAVGAAALVASAARTAVPISTAFPEAAYEIGGGRNVVNVILVDLRAWDTVGEISVLLVAATGVASMIFLSRQPRGGAGPRPDAQDADGDGDRPGGADDAGDRPGGDSGLPPYLRTAVSRGTWLRSLPEVPAERRSLILETVTRLTFHTVVLFSLYLLFAGHNNVGGGFAGGLVAGLALMVRYLAGGRRELDMAAPLPAGLLLGAGLFLSAGVGLVGQLAGYTPLQSTVLEWHVPVLGTVHLVTALFFDIGVYLVVVGLMLDVLRSLGGGIDRHLEAAAEQEAEKGAGDDAGAGAPLSLSGGIPRSGPAAGPEEPGGPAASGGRGQQEVAR